MWYNKLLYKAYKLGNYFTRPLTVGVRLLPIKGDEIVLVRHTYQNSWYLPGGGVKKGETLEQAIRREAQEELGADLHALHLFGVYSNFYEYKNDHIAVFLTRDFSLQGASDYEIERVETFPLTALPEDLSPGSKRRVEEYRQYDFPYFGRW
ncbi:MAG: NUDIX domain-containing protein [Candidatus Latescibacteria bacterium]|nr:NUDIX domain-containing protein [Candidatus Latescibacterota bacterium]